MEGVGITLFADVYRGRRVLITGHTGFKGSWLALWLCQLGAEVTGVSLDPEDRQLNHWQLLNLNGTDLRHDIRDAAKIARLLERARPEIVFHLAAQSLVRRSYREPITNWSTNLMGTTHVLEACRAVDSVKAIVAITTDKVYSNQEWPWGYRENDRLGGHDPYSASKAACELLIESYRRAFFGEAGKPLLASGRSGNVIGGGDWAEDRLIPDLVRSLARGEPLVIRSPHATRPWQHVLECLSGYLLLGQKLFESRREYAGAWNFGPGPEDNRTVSEVLEMLRTSWPELSWERTREPVLHEANLLYLDPAKARTELGWRPVWRIERALQITATWYRQFHEKRAVLSRQDLAQYIDDAESAAVPWTKS